MKKILFLPFIIFIFSCGNHTEVQLPLPSDPTPPPQVQQQEDFISFVKGITTSNINQYINKENGLWLIQMPGAVPTMTNTSQVDKNFPVDFTAIKNEELPKVNCDSKSLWTKEGCFVQQVNSFKDEKIWTFCGLSKEDESKIEKLAQTISFTVINTSLNARYYFSLIDRKWYLVFADLRRPCEA